MKQLYSGVVLLKKFIALLIIVAMTVLFTVFATIYSASNKLVRIRVVTTTSLYATGLLEYLASEFKNVYKNVEFDFIPAGSGEALRRAEMGDACIVFVHAPQLEEKYISKGVIVNHTIFAYNYFIIAGPPNDPADIRNSRTVFEAFMKIYNAGEKEMVIFVSRGDNSGTHIKELSIWEAIGLNPHGRAWYRETGSGMGNTLIVANELKAYVLSDIGTFLKFKKEGRLPNLVILYTNDTELINIYSVYLVASCKGVEKEYAAKFIDFIRSKGQELIAKYGVEEYGQQLFMPAYEKIVFLTEIWERLAKSQRV